MTLCAVAFGGVRPLLARHFARRGAHEGLHASDVPILVVGALACAFATDYLQVHAAFGAFLFGLRLPRDDRLLAALRARIEPMVMLVLMPASSCSRDWTPPATRSAAPVRRSSH